MRWMEHLEKAGSVLVKHGAERNLEELLVKNMSLYEKNMSPKVL